MNLSKIPHDKYGDVYAQVLLQDMVTNSRCVYARLWNETNLFICIDSLLGEILSKHPSMITTIPLLAVDEDATLNLEGDKVELMRVESFDGVETSDLMITFKDVWPKGFDTKLHAFEMADETTHRLIKLGLLPIDTK